jgi:starvation-inducible DNA-binding protein
MRISKAFSGKKDENITVLLTAVLENQMTLFSQKKKFYWNVKRGRNFFEIHKLLDEHYKLLEDSILEASERIDKMSNKSIVKINLIAPPSENSENKFPSSKKMIQDRIRDHQVVIKHIRKNIDDCVKKHGDKKTAVFLTGLLQKNKNIVDTLKLYLKEL